MVYVGLHRIVSMDRTIKKASLDILHIYGTVPVLLFLCCLDASVTILNIYRLSETSFVSF